MPQMMAWQGAPLPHLKVPLRQVSALAHCLVDGVVAHEDSTQACLLHSGHALPTPCTHPVFTPGTPQTEHMFAWDLK